MTTSTSQGSSQIRDPRKAPFKPYGNLDQAFYCKDSEYLVSGGAGTGKTRALLEKIYILLCLFPGARILLIRKTRSSLNQSGLVTWEQKVLPGGSPLIGTMQRKNRQEYNFPNGSTLVVGGGDNLEKVLSSEYDIIYCQEALEFTLEDWELLKGRLRNFVIPYQQIIGDCNPTTPTHWLKKRCDAGICTLINTSHQDNPVLFSIENGDWTKEGEAYLKTLGEMTGARLQRFLYGLWIKPEGARWPDITREEHGFELRNVWHQGIPEGWLKWISIDYGTADPYCCLWHTINPQMTDIYTYREDYIAGLTATEQAQRVCEMSPKNEQYRRVRMDPNIWTPFPNHDKNRVQSKSAHELYEPVFRTDGRFGPLEKGYNQSRVHGWMFLDSILGRGNSAPDWHIANTCTNLWSELENAVYTKTRDGKYDEDIEERNDHALAASVYGLHDEYRRIERVTIADLVDPAKIRAAIDEKRTKQSESEFRQFANDLNRHGRVRLGGHSRRSRQQGR